MPQWLQTLLGVLAGGALTLAGTVWVGKQNSRTSGREEWFRRVQWAQQMTRADDEATKASGYKILSYLSESPLATADDQGLLEQMAADPALRALSGAGPEVVDEIDYVRDNGDTSDSEGSRAMSTPVKSSSDGAATAERRRRIQKVTPSMIASAQAQVAIAKKLERALPPAIVKIAQVR